MESARTKGDCFAKDILHALGLPRGEAVGVSRGPFAPKVMVLLRTSFTFSSTQYASMKASSRIYTVFYHALGLLRGVASRCFTGTVRTKSDGFAKNILHFFGIAVCLYESFITHLHCVYHALGLLKGVASRCFMGSVRTKSDGFAKDILHFWGFAGCLYESFIMHLHCVLSCFTPPKGGGF